MFKIGDEVEVYVETVFVEGEDILNGEKGIIIKDCGDYCRVKFNNKNLNIMNVKSSFLKPLTPTPFTKKDLKDNDRVFLREFQNKDEELIVFKNTLFAPTFEPIELNEYNSDLTHCKFTDLDIMQVTRSGEVVFKREESLNFYMKYHYCSSGKITEDVKQFLKKHDVENKIIEVRIEEVEKGEEENIKPEVSI